MMMFHRLQIALAALLVVLLVSAPAAVSGRLFYVVRDPFTHDYFVVEEIEVSSKLQGRQNDVRAIVNYTHSIMTTGWDVLNVTTAADMPDEEQAYAAGYGEGVATWEATWNNYQNQAQPGQPPMPANISAWVQQNWEWMSSMSASLNATNPYWKQVGLLQLQFHGLLDGLNAAAPNASSQFTFDMLQSINLAGDLMDLYAALNISEMSSTWRDMSKAEFQSWFARSTHCSALVKLKYDYSDIFFGHATWSTFNMMVRVYKHYHLNFHNVNATTISLSGYAGVLASIDDYYVANNGLAITETSFTILNNSLYTNCNPQQLFYWVRALVATRLANTAKDWCELFAEYNSGTYNNQWIVLDTKKFTPYEDLVPGTLYIAEQIPGQVGIRDVTSTLQYGYWPSYNIPSIEELYVISGNQEAAETQGWEMNDYERCVRAQIFRRDQANVVDIPSMQYMMQYNDYVYDPISQGNPTYAVASRGDLTPEQPMCWGAIDAKITSASLMRNGLQTWAFSGPTPQQPVFDALTTNATIMCSPHLGQPNIWNFSFVFMQPQPYQDQI